MKYIWIKFAVKYIGKKAFRSKLFRNLERVQIENNYTVYQVSAGRLNAIMS